MPQINHLNYFTGDASIYCEKQGEVVHCDQYFVDTQCCFCTMWSGSLQGEGIECYYDDPDATEDDFVICAADPYEFMERRRRARGGGPGAGHRKNRDEQG